MTKAHSVHELEELRGRAPVFRDRRAAGVALAGMLQRYHGTNALILAIPAGGVPVAAEVAARLAVPLDIAPVSKVLLPWTTESGYGAVAFDGSVWIIDDAAARFGLSKEQIEHGVSEARAKVERRMTQLRGGQPLSRLTGRPVILVDDGIAAGSTMRTAVAAVRQQAAVPIIVAVPTGHGSAIEIIAELADEVYCANIRSGIRFAVADAYEEWSDVSEGQVAAILEQGSSNADANGTSRAATDTYRPKNRHGC
jgi:putative phosphoribosyl transferase